LIYAKAKKVNNDSKYDFKGPNYHLLLMIFSPSWAYKKLFCLASSLCKVSIKSKIKLLVAAGKLNQTLCSLLKEMVSQEQCKVIINEIMKR